MHIADFSVGMLGANGVVGANIVIAAGAAHAIKLRGESRIVCCIFGDGAINRGPFLEGLNWARVFDLPVLFVCEDNGFAATTRTRSMTGGEGPAARAQSLGLETATADGNDVLALDALSQRVIERIRNGGGPEFMHLETYRLAGHTASDPALYRPAAEVAARRADDPIARLRDTLVLAGVGEQMLDAIVFQAQEAMARVLDEARNTPFPPAAHAYADVQDVGDPRETAC